MCENSSEADAIFNNAKHFDVSDFKWRLIELCGSSWWLVWRKHGREPKSVVVTMVLNFVKKSVLLHFDA